MPQRKKQPNKSPTERRTPKRSSKMGFYELSPREDQLVRLGIKTGVEETVNALRELFTGRANYSLQDGSVEMLRQRGVPRG